MPELKNDFGHDSKQEPSGPKSCSITSTLQKDNGITLTDVLYVYTPVLNQEPCDIKTCCLSSTLQEDDGICWTNLLLWVIYFVLFT